MGQSSSPPVSSSIEIVNWLGRKADNFHPTPDGEGLVFLSFTIKGNKGYCDPDIQHALFEMARRARAGNFTSPFITHPNDQNEFAPERDIWNSELNKYNTPVFGFVNFSASPWYGMYVVIIVGIQGEPVRHDFSICYNGERDASNECKPLVVAPSFVRLTFDPPKANYVVVMQYADDDLAGLSFRLIEIKRKP